MKTSRNQERLSGSSLYLVTKLRKARNLLSVGSLRATRLSIRLQKKAGPANKQVVPWATIVHSEPLNPSAPTGGIEVWIRDFLKFSRKGYRVLGVGPFEIESSVAKGNPSEYVEISRAPQKRGGLPKSLRFAVSLLPRRRLLTGVLIVHRLDLVWVVRLLRPRSKIILVVHTDLLAQKVDGERIWRRLPSAMYFPYERWALGTVDLVSSQSSSDYTRIENLAQKSELLHGWFDDTVFVSDSTVIKHNSVVWVGRLEPTKNPELALTAFARSSLAKNHSLTFIGEGSLRERLCQTTKELGLEGCVQLVGHLNQSALAGELQRAKILIHTSLFEATPKIFLEALACGVFLVAHERNDPEGWCAEGNNGLRALTYDPFGFSSALNIATSRDTVPGPRNLLLDSRSARRMIPGIEARWHTVTKSP